MRTMKINRRRAVRSMTVARHPFFEGLRSLGSLGGDNVNGKTASFTTEELVTLRSALQDMSQKFSSLSLAI